MCVGGCTVHTVQYPHANTHSHTHTHSLWWNNALLLFSVFSLLCSLSTYLIIPPPCFRVDGLPHSAQHAQTAQVTCIHRVITKSHQGPDGSGGSVELLDL